jgi:hypothetical protein
MVLNSFKCLRSCGLFCIFLVSSVAGSITLGPDDNLDRETTIVLGSFFFQNGIPWDTKRVTLRIFKERTLIIVVCLRLIQNVRVCKECSMNKPLRRFRSAIQIDGPENCFKGIRQNRFGATIDRLHRTVAKEKVV